MNATLLIVGLALLAADPAPKNRFTGANIAKEGVAGSSRFESGGASPAVPLDADDKVNDGTPAKSRFGADRFTPAARTAKGVPEKKAEPLVPIETGITAAEKPAEVKRPKKNLKRKPNLKLNLREK